MKRQFIFAAMFVGAVSGCVSTENGPETGGVRANYGKSFGPPSVPGVEGPYGTKIPMAAPYNMAPPGSQYAAKMMMNNNIPDNLVQRHGPGMFTPPGVPSMPGMPSGLPGMPGPMPGGMSPMPGGMPPGAMPGNPLLRTSAPTMLPDAGVTNANVSPSTGQPGGVTPAQFAGNSPVGAMFPAQRTQIYFGNPVRMKVYWSTQGPDGKPNYSATPLETPGRYNFAQGAIYRLKLTNIPGRPALELYPTLEVVPTGPRTNEFLAHNSVPIDFSEDDFKQVVDRNYIVKVIYLPDPQFQDAAGAGPGEITSAQLEPGQDPIQEALRRGSILLVMRIGNIDQGLISSPPLNAPIPSGPPMMMKPPGMGVPPNFQVPFNFQPVAPGMPGMMPPGAIPPGAIPPGGFGGGPNPLPPLAPGNTPPLFKVPELPAPGAGNPLNPNKVETIKPPVLPAPPGLKPEEGIKPLDIPLIPLPSVPAPNLEKPAAAPILNPVEKTSRDTSNPSLAPLPPVIPASTSKETGSSVTPGSIQPSIMLPPATLPTVTPGASSQPSLPSIPPIPELPERK